MEVIMVRLFFLIIISTSFLFPLDQFKKLTLEERAKYKMKIEEVYQSFRTDGKNNKLPDFQFFLKEAEKDLKYTEGLKIFFNFDIKEENLQKEFERICSNTKQPEVLKKIFEVLENDPNLIADVFVRSVLARRLIESYYYQDEKFQKPLRDKVKEEIKGARYASDLKYLSGEYNETVVKVRDKIGGPPEKNSIRYNKFEFENFLNNLTKKFNLKGESKLQIGSISKIIEDREGIRVLGILDKGNGYIKICSSFWKKKRFHKWWEEVEGKLSYNLNFKKGNFKMPNLRSGSCKDDTWYKIAGPPDERYGCASLVSGTNLIIWGGINEELIPVNTGFKYDSSSDSWSEISSVNAPSPRKNFMAYSGFYLYIWGGQDTSDNYLNTGAYYNPSRDEWNTIRATGDVPSGRIGGALTYYGILGLILFGGENASGKLNDTHFYSFNTNTWYIMTTGGTPPSPRSFANAVVYSDIMFVWGGRDISGSPLNDGKKLAFGSSHTWYSIASAPANNARYYHTMLLYGSKALIWGGIGTGNSPLNTGLVYDISSDTWLQMSSSGLSGRYGHSAVLASGEMIIWGGTNGSEVYYDDGARYNISGNSWTSVSTGPDKRAFHCAGWTGTYMIIWGGKNFEDILGSGGRYNPSSNSWTPTYDGGVPSPRYGYGAVWTGSEVIVFGGWFVNSPYNNGRKYIPSTDTWEAIADADIIDGRSYFAFHYWQAGGKAIAWGGVGPSYVNLGDGALYDVSSDSWVLVNDTDPDKPIGRSYFASDWDGSKMYVWGGYIDNDPYYTNTGAIYDPSNSTDPWVSMTTTGAPSERAIVTGVWSGSKFIVWGGEDVSWVPLNTGGVYDPLTNSWTETNTTDPDTPSPRAYHHSKFIDTGMFVWGGDDYVSQSLGDGAIYSPSTDSWSPLPSENAPSPRLSGGYEWNGRDLIIWGGYDSWTFPTPFFNNGSRYNSSNNLFSPMSENNAPGGRSDIKSVWLDKYFFVWGGYDGRYPVTGGLYCSCLAPPPQSTNPSPPNGGKGCANSPVELTCQNEEANSFDIYIDSILECENVSSCYCSKSLNTGPHTWFVESSNYCGTASGTPTTWSFEVIDVPGAATNPNPPVGSSQCSSNPLVVSWTAGDNSEQYDVYLGTNLMCSNITQTSCNFGTLAGGNYTWYVVSKNICGSQQGPTWSFSIDSSNPSQATNPNPANGSSVCPDPDLSWDPASGARTYDVYLDSELKCSNIEATTCDPGTISSGSHSWYVVSKNSCGNTQGSVWNFSIKNPPGQASNPSPYDGEEICTLTPTLTFSAAPNATSYDVYVDGGLKCADITGTSCSPGTLSVGQHTWYVVSKNGCPTQNNTGPTWTFYADNGAPGLIQNPVPPDGSYPCPVTVLDWDPALNARSYDVYLDDIKICSNIKVTYCNTNVSSGSHSWYVLSKNRCGTTQSGPYSFSILQTPSAPTVQDADPCALSGVQISWGSVAGATGYDLRVDGSTIISNVTSPYTYQPGNSNSHSYEIRAKNSQCTKPWSTSTSGTDENQTPSSPSITSIVDLDSCSQSGIKIYFTPGSPATRHDLYRNGIKVVENYTSGSTYNPASTSTFTYYIRAVNGTCFKDSSSQDFADENNTPSTPSITSIVDLDSCSQSGIKIYFTPGSPATRHDLYRNGIKVVENYTSGSTYNPASTSTFTYYIRAVNGTCFKDSSSQDFADENNTPSTPSITSIVDLDSCSQSGIKIYFTPGSPATRHDLYRNGEKVVENYISGSVYNPGSTSSYNYYVRAVNGTCFKDSSTQSFADGDSTPSQPIINLILDADSCSQSGIKIYFSPGSPATRHDLYRNGEKVVENYISGSVYNPGSTSSYNYYVRAVNGTCFRDSSSQDFSDEDHTPNPTISGPNQNTCPNEFVVLSTETGMSNYQWYINGQTISGANNSQYTATQSGNYTISYTNSYGCSNTSGPHSVTISPCFGPPPVADGKLYGGAAKFVKASDFGTTGNINVTFDNITCSNHHISILYGNILGSNNFDGYDGCALENGGNSGSTTFNSTGQENVWYNIIWVSDYNRAGHPGYKYINGTDQERNWSAIGFCSIASELQNDPTCD